MICGFASRSINNRYVNSADSATDILDKRYASDEIEREEYGEKKRNLNKPSELFQ